MRCSYVMWLHSLPSSLITSLCALFGCSYFTFIRFSLTKCRNPVIPFLGAFGSFFFFMVFTFLSDHLIINYITFFIFLIFYIFYTFLIIIFCCLFLGHFLYFYCIFIFYMISICIYSFYTHIYYTFTYNSFSLVNRVKIELSK